MEVPLATSSTTINVEHFWNSVFIYHDRPHLVNKKVVAITQSLFLQVTIDMKAMDQSVNEFFTREAILYETRKSNNDLSSNFVRNILEVHSKSLSLRESNQKEFTQCKDEVFVSVRSLIGRGKTNCKCVEVVTFDQKRNRVTFHAVNERDQMPVAPDFPYHIHLNSSGNLIISVDNFDYADTSSAEWLADKLFERLLKWTEPNPKSNVINSLSLISPDKYCQLYNELKANYASDLLKVWPDNAKTNPEKFIFEDLGIAAYLICLWNEMQVKDVSFVDLGCGNGLLVYILTKYGYSGYGIDVRSRKLWEYFEDSKLIIDTVSPTSVYSDATWLIGNHSDELTPWIPIIALKSSSLTNFFLLPCCPYDFDGTKYKRSDTRISQYEDYMKYVKNISDMCGFDTKIDKLRIASTKRTCFVGIRDRTVDLNKIDKFVRSRMKLDFTARNPVEVTRNCTQLDKDLICRVIELVVKQLLETENRVPTWNKGGTVPIPNIIARIPTEDLKALKNNCGGLQTLLKNHRYIFEVTKGTVALRKPPTLKDTQRYKEKPCWFHLHHPDGCLYTYETCGYEHK